MINLKTTAIVATLFAFTASSALAGGMAEPIMTMEPAMVMEESASSSSGLIVPLILLTLVGIALAGRDSGTNPLIDGPQVIQVTQ